MRSSRSGLGPLPLDDSRQELVDHIKNFARAEVEIVTHLKRHVGIHLAGDGADFLGREDVHLRAVTKPLRRAGSGKELDARE